MIETAAAPEKKLMKWHNASLGNMANTIRSTLPGKASNPGQYRLQMTVLRGCVVLPVFIKPN